MASGGAGGDPPHAVIQSFGSKPHGLYSSKGRGSEKAYDTMGKPMVYTAIQSPFQQMKPMVRDAHKGKQLKVTYNTGPLNKLVYAPSAYDPEKAKAEANKKGFGTGGGRGDIATIRDTLCYRYALEQEAKHASKAAEAMAAKHGISEAEATAAATASLTRAAGPDTAQRPTGLTQKLRSFGSEYDRAHFVDDRDTIGTRKFVAANFERDNGSLRTMGSSLGEGCFDKSALRFDRHGKHDFARAFSSKEHPVPAMIAGPLSV